MRENGSDGKISCYVKSGPGTTTSGSGMKNAVEYEDYTPIYEPVYFDHGEVEKIVTINLVSIKPIKESELENGKVVEDVASPKEDANDDEGQDKVFKVTIEKPDPASVKLSRKNQVTITLCHNSGEAQSQDQNDKLI